MNETCVVPHPFSAANEEIAMSTRNLRYNNIPELPLIVSYSASSKLIEVMCEGLLTARQADRDRAHL